MRYSTGYSLNHTHVWNKHCMHIVRIALRSAKRPRVFLFWFSVANNGCQHEQEARRELAKANAFYSTLWRLGRVTQWSVGCLTQRKHFTKRQLTRSLSSNNYKCRIFKRILSSLVIKVLKNTVFTILRPIVTPHVAILLRLQQRPISKEHYIWGSFDYAT